NLLMALAAAALGFLISRALLAGSVRMVLSLLPPEFVESMDVVLPPGDWRVWAFLFGGAFVATVMFGLAPALQSTRLELVRAMRGEVTRDARPSRVRQLLIGSQVTASALLLVCAECSCAARTPPRPRMSASGRTTRWWWPGLRSRHVRRCCTPFDNTSRSPRWPRRGHSPWAVASQSKPPQATRRSVSATN